MNLTFNEPACESQPIDSTEHARFDGIFFGEEEEEEGRRRKNIAESQLKTELICVVELQSKIESIEPEQKSQTQNEKGERERGGIKEREMLRDASSKSVG